MRVSVLVFQDCVAMTSITCVELLRQADIVCPPAFGEPERFFDVELVSAGESLNVRASNGFPVQCERTVRDTPITDLVLVPAFDGDVLDQLAKNREATVWVRAAYDAGASVASSCTGAFLLAEAGLLDGRAATTHWVAQDLFQRRYPRVKLLPERIIVDEGRVCTSGGATSYLNLLMYLVEKYRGAEAARVASKMFLIDLHKVPQNAYAMLSNQKNHNDREVLEAQAIIEDRFRQPLRVAALAHEVAVSPRHFARRFKTATSNTPSAYIKRVRIEAAKRVLEDGHAPISEVAIGVGYEDIASFRTIFRQVTGLSPTEYRRRYSPLLERIPAEQRA
jgi:transcriptional regulator GlxA family with amidase domain